MILSIKGNNRLFCQRLATKHKNKIKLLPFSIISFRVTINVAFGVYFKMAALQKRRKKDQWNCIKK